MMDNWQLNTSPVVRLERLNKTFVQFSLFWRLNCYRTTFRDRVGTTEDSWTVAP